MALERRVKISISITTSLRDRIEELVRKEGLTFSGALSLVASKGLRELR